MAAKYILGVFAALTVPALLPQPLSAQGSIWGLVHNADMSVPPDSTVEFIGFLRNTDNEIRTQSCIGAGYEIGFWYDDFQNYLDEAVGIQYRYYFFNRMNNQAIILSGSIPNNSYEQQDVTLAPADFPAPAQGLAGIKLTSESVRLDWMPEDGVTWHVYRRTGSSDGSFFRRDNPSGDRSDPGVSEPFYVDNDVDSGGCYSYTLVTESASGDYSPASAVVEVNLASCCQGQVGDVNGLHGDEPTIGDIAMLINYLFINFTEPPCLAEADVNQSGGLNPTRPDISIADIAILINHLYINFVPLHLCTDVGY